MIRIIKIIVHGLLKTMCFAQMLSAQATLDTPISPQKTVIGGCVVDASTNKPIADMRIDLASSSSSKSVRTNKDGCYVFSGEHSGSVSLTTITEKGYLSTLKQLTLAPGQSLDSVVLKVVKSAVIGGRVLYSSKRPVLGASVHLQREGILRGRKTLLGSYVRRTNDQGEYRFTNLRPGRYILEVVPPQREFRELPAPTQRTRSEVEPSETEAITYYMNAPARTGATKLEVRAGDVQEDVDVVILRSRSICVSTTIQRPPGRGDMDWISATLTEASPQSQTRLAWGRFRREGLIEVCGVTPGEYRLTISSVSSDGETILAGQIFSASGTSNIALPPSQLKPPRNVRGRVFVTSDRMEEVAGVLSTISILLEPKDRLTNVGEVLRSGEISSEGNFTIPATFEDEYWVNIDGLPSGYFVKSVRSSGRDVYTHPFSAVEAELEVELGINAPIITGVVTDQNDLPLSNAVVVLVKTTASSEVTPNTIFSARCEPSGEFKVDNIPPGTYYLAAIVGEIQNHVFSEDTIQQVRQSSYRETVTLNDKKTVRIKSRIVGR